MATLVVFCIHYCIKRFSEFTVKFFNFTHCGTLFSSLNHPHTFFLINFVLNRLLWLNFLKFATLILITNNIYLQIRPEQFFQVLMSPNTKLPSLWHLSHPKIQVTLKMSELQTLKFWVVQLKTGRNLLIQQLC